MPFWYTSSSASQSPTVDIYLCVVIAYVIVVGAYVIASTAAPPVGVHRACLDVTSEEIKARGECQHTGAREPASEDGRPGTSLAAMLRWRILRIIEQFCDEIRSERSSV